MLSPRHLEHLGAALQALRKQSGFTQNEICANTGLRTPQMSRWENGHEIPTLESLVKYLGVIGAGLADLERVLLGQAEDSRRVQVHRVALRIRQDHNRQLRSRAELRRAMRKLMRLSPIGLERFNDSLREASESSSSE